MISCLPVTMRKVADIPIQHIEIWHEAFVSDRIKLIKLQVIALNSYTGYSN